MAARWFVRSITLVGLALLLAVHVPAEARYSRTLPPPAPCSSFFWSASYLPHFLHWTSDSSRLVLNYGSRIYSVEVDGSEIREVLDPRPPISLYDWALSWLPPNVGVIHEGVTAMSSVNQAETIPDDWRDRKFDVEGIYAELSPDGSSILHSSCRYSFRENSKTYNSEIAIGYFDGRPQERLTTNLDYDGFPSWSSNGNKVAYVSSDGLEGPGKLVIAELPLEQEPLPVPLDSMVIVHSVPQWSPVGEQLAFLAHPKDPDSGLVSREQQALYTIDSRNFSTVQISEALSLPAWSPDGKRIAVFALHQNGTGLFTFAADGTDRKMIAPVSEQLPVRRYLSRHYGFQPAWSPDGSRIAFTYESRYRDSVRMNFGVVNADGTELTKMLADTVMSAQWSPDGSSIAVAGVDDKENLLIQILTPDGAGRRVLVRGVAGDSLLPESTFQEDPVSFLPRCFEGTIVSNPGDNPGLAEDCQTLLAIRDTLGGRNGIKGGPLLNWYPGTNIDAWAGVTVRGTPPRVQRLSLSKFHLAGAIPEEIAKLSELRKLDLSSNFLGGVIPSELGQLANLEILTLSSNGLEGNIPPELGELKELE